MFSLPLLKREIKSNYKIFLIFVGVLAMYVSVIVFMFDPKIGDTLRSFEEAMPGIMSAFGMSLTGSTLIAFLGSYLFGMLLLIFPMIYEIIVANKLVARYVDKGSMAYLLATPNKRKKIALTQAFFLIMSVALLLLITLFIGIGCSQVMFPGELDIPKYILLHVGLLGLHLTISGLAFLASCIFDDTKYANAVSAGIPILFYLIQMLVNMGDKLENLKYFTIYTLFDVDKLIAGETSAIIGIVGLGIIGIVLYAVGIVRFTKRDLPL